MRVGQKNGLVYQWAKKGTRPRQPKDQRYANAYVFGAICPARDTGTALVLPRADADAMQHHLEAISCRVAPGAHAGQRLIVATICPLLLYVALQGVSRCYDLRPVA